MAPCKCSAENATPEKGSSEITYGVSTEGVIILEIDGMWYHPNGSVLTSTDLASPPRGANGSMRGHFIYYDDQADEWRYFDGAKADDSRPCVKCGEYPTPEGHDACLGTLPGVRYACCGHGAPLFAYVQYKDGTLVDGEIAA